MNKIRHNLKFYGKRNQISGKLSNVGLATDQLLLPSKCVHETTLQYRRNFSRFALNSPNGSRQEPSISFRESPRSIASRNAEVPAIRSNGLRSYSYSYGGSFQRKLSPYMSKAVLTIATPVITGSKVSRSVT